MLIKLTHKSLSNPGTFFIDGVAKGICYIFDTLYR